MKDWQLWNRTGTILKSEQTLNFYQVNGNPLSCWSYWISPNKIKIIRAEVDSSRKEFSDGNTWRRSVIDTLIFLIIVLLLIKMFGVFQYKHNFDNWEVKLVMKRLKNLLFTWGWHMVNKPGSYYQVRWYYKHRTQLVNCSTENCLHIQNVKKWPVLDRTFFRSSCLSDRILILINISSAWTNIVSVMWLMCGLKAGVQYVTLFVFKCVNLATKIHLSVCLFDYVWGPESWIHVCGTHLHCWSCCG